MVRRIVKVRDPSNPAWLEIVSHGRRSGSASKEFSPAALEIIARTVRHTPEVMVKVSGGGRNSKGVEAHVKYIDRHGRLDVETDTGERLRGKDVAKDLVDSWNLDATDFRRLGVGGAGSPARPLKLVHNIVLSMPAKTDPKRFLEASRAFAREHFALKHRYALVLHTDQAHPHVHLVVKAVSEQGLRLNIRKATLRDWREQFARELRAVGIAANATPRAFRGSANAQLPDGLFRLLRRQQEPTAKATRHERFAMPQAGSRPPKSSSAQSAARRALAGWKYLHDALTRGGEHSLAEEVQAYAVALNVKSDVNSRNPVVRQR